MASTELLTAIMALLLDVGERQRATIAKMVAAVWLAGSMTITTLARAAAIRFQQQPRTLHKAFDRALGSVAIDPMEIYRSHARRVLRGRRVVRIAIDWLSLRNDSMRVLLAAMCDDQGRATPLLALSVATKHRKRRQRAIEAKMVLAIREVVPADVTVILLADRGFDGAAFRAEVRAAKLHYVIRVRGNLTAWWSGKKYTTRKLACSRSDGAIRREGVSLTAKKESPGSFVTCWDEKSKGPWLLVTDVAGDAKAIVEHYARRFEIEECIRDMKNARLGLGLEEVRTKQVNRWEVLLAVTVVAYTIVRRCGEIARDRGLARQFSTSGRRVRSHSTFSLGLFHAEASPQILQQALGITPAQDFSRAA